MKASTTMGAARNGNVWKPTIVAILIPLLGLAVAFGVLKSDVGHNTHEIRAVEVRSNVADQAMEERITNQLTRIEDKLDALLEKSNGR